VNRKVPTYGCRPCGDYVYSGFPCTIVNDRYGGVYSGAEWVAFPCEPDEVPEDVNADDTDSMAFWEFGRAQPLVGRGKTAEEARLDLMKRVAEYDWSKHEE